MISLSVPFFFQDYPFADNIILTCSFSNMSVESITNYNNQNLETINHWLSVNKIKVNAHKKYRIVFFDRNKIFLALIRLGRETRAQTENRI